MVVQEARSETEVGVGDGYGSASGPTFWAFWRKEDDVCGGWFVVSEAGSGSGPRRGRRAHWFCAGGSDKRALARRIAHAGV